MKKVLFIALLLSFNVFSQDTIFFKKVDDFKRNYFEVGIQNPQKELADKFNKSYNIGVWFRNKVAKNQFIDVGLEFNFLNKPSEINYTHIDSIVHLESNKIGLKAGLRYSKVVPVSKNLSIFSVESNSGLGWTALYYTIPEYYDGTNLRDELEKKKNLHTLFLSQTVKFYVYDFGIFCTYYYAPYAIFKKNVEANFGSQSICFGMVYRL